MVFLRTLRTFLRTLRTFLRTLRNFSVVRSLHPHELVRAVSALVRIDGSMRALHDALRGARHLAVALGEVADGLVRRRLRVARRVVVVLRQVERLLEPTALEKVLVPARPWRAGAPLSFWRRQPRPRGLAVATKAEQTLELAVLLQQLE